MILLKRDLKYSSGHKTQEGEEMDPIHSLPLHTSHVDQPRATINRLHTFLHFFAIVALLYYRVASLFMGNIHVISSFFPWVLITASELLLSFHWLLGQALRWRPIRRTVYPERLPGDEELPPIDVFICTADPKKEPTVDVMNTVLSAMCLDYPPEKLSVYLSDDAGAPVTLLAMREAFSFARTWVPFCKIYGIKTRYPEAYFGPESVGDKEYNGDGTTKFMDQREEIKLKYKNFRQHVEKASGNEEILSSPHDRPPLIEVIAGHESDEVHENRAILPLLVYVSREKRSSHPHHFKAGALNVLLRVSAIISNAPYILSLDCDMYCNDPTSARQAMCFHLDPKISPSLAFVQFPQEFHNWNKNDIYNEQIAIVYKVLCHGVDGIEGPWLVGTGFFLKRESLFRRSPQTPLEGLDSILSTRCVGSSNEFIASLCQNHKFKVINSGDEATVLASCIYEKDTQWGEEIGFMYHCVVEDYFTGFILHSKGWNSVYRDPSRAAFLGSVATNLNDCLIQTTRWEAGFLQVGFSRFCPLIYGPSKMSLLQCMCYAYFAVHSLKSIPLLCYATVPQFCLFNGTPLYPKATSPWFYVMGIVYILSGLQHLFETRSAGGSFQLWWNQYRIHMMKSVTSYFLACLDIVMKWIGKKEIKFVPTNKVANEEQEQRYNMGVFDFQAETIFLLPLTTIVNLNIACLVLGLKRAVVDTTYDEMFGHIVLSFIILILGYPTTEGMILRRDSGRIPTSVTLSSVALVCVIISLGYAYD